MLEEIFVNGRFRFRPVTGVERFAGEIARRLCPPNRVISPGRGYEGLAGHCWEQAILPQRLPPGALLWSPGNTGPLRHRNQAVAIHDVAPLDHPEWYRPAFRIWYRLLLPRLTRNSRLVITVSEFSRKRIAERLGIASDRIAVLPGGVDQSVFYPREPDEVHSALKRFGIEGDYLLAVGTIQPRKNLPGLIKAWEVVRKVFPDLSLAIVGGVTSGVFRKPDLEKWSQRVIWTGYLPDGDLAALYSGAQALVFPSYYEGFGLPILEAMACGTSVLASSAGAPPETAGDAGLYFDPDSYEEMVECILAVLRYPELRQDLVRKGKQRAQGYTWERSAGILSDYLASIV